MSEYSEGASGMGANTTYRVLVSTDLGGDPDDIQSLIHLLHYSDILKVEGIVSSPGPGSVNSAELIKEWVMRTDLDHLRAKGNPKLMSESEVLPLVKQGTTEAGAPRPGNSTEGSEWIIRCARAEDPLEQGRPLWVLVWGSLTDVAQALHDDPGIAERIRIYYIGCNNTVRDPESYDYVIRGFADRWPNLWMIENGIFPPRSRDTFRGYYLGGEQDGEWGNVAFVERNIRGRGTTSGGRFREKLGDAFPVADSPKGVLKEGDSPSFLYLLSPVVGGVGDVNDPTGESWGGRYRQLDPENRPNYYVDLDAPAAECQATINKWRKAFLQDWKQRWWRYV
jgi:hypothetical protein